MERISYYIIIIFIVMILLYGIIKKINVYDSFIKGAFDSLKTGIQILPYLLSMFVAVNVFKASGILNDLLILIPFGLGGLIGIVIISKVLNKLLLKHSMSIWYIILGLLISSIYTVYESVYNNYLFDNMSIFYGNIKFNIVGSVILFLTAICCLSKLKSINNNKTKKEVLL